jgi:hypothetical protein
MFYLQARMVTALAFGMVLWRHISGYMLETGPGASV